MAKDYEQHKPTKKQILAPIIIFLAATVIGISLLMIAHQFQGSSEDIILKVPTTQQVELSEVGEYTIYLAQQVQFEGKAYTLSKDYQGLEMKVMLGEKEIELSPAQKVYDYGDETDLYRNVYTFNVEKGGTYLLECTLSDESVKEAIVLIAKTKEHAGIILGMVIVACMILLMGTCQLIGYLVYNSINFGIYIYKKRMDM